MKNAIKINKFKKDKYMIVRKSINGQVVKFIDSYFMLKRRVTRTFFDDKYISQFTHEWGVFNDPEARDTYSHYADIAMETLLTWAQPVVERQTAYHLSPTFSYARIYKRGDIIKHTNDDQVSALVYLGGDAWPIFIGPEKKKILLEPADMLVYQKGCVLQVEPFQGEHHTQVFLHFNQVDDKGLEPTKYDKRPHLGLPAWFKKR